MFLQFLFYRILWGISKLILLESLVELSTENASDAVLIFSLEILYYTFYFARDCGPV